MATSKQKVFSNLIWRFMERCGAQLVAFIVSIVLARILSPSDYGIVALITVLTTILQVFVDSGLGNALIQKKDADDLDFSSVFYSNIVFCSVLYIAVFIAAPFIAKFYNDASLAMPIRVLSLTVLISGVKNVQQAYVSRHMMFKKLFFSTLGGTIIAAVVGIPMALNGFGVWALIAQQVINLSIDTLVLWITVKWRPSRKFSFQRLKDLYSFGWKLLASALLDTVYNNIRQLIIGKVYSSSDLAYYNRGKQFPNLVIDNVNTAIDSVMFPIISAEQDNIECVKALTRRSIRTSSFIIWPVVMGMAVCAEPVVKILLTDKWIACVPYLQIFCLIYGFWPIHTANLNAIKAVGRSDVFLKLEIIKKCVGIISILISLPFGVMTMAIAYLITSPISALINAFPNRKLLNYSYRDQLQDMLPSMLLSLGMALCVSMISKLSLNIFLFLVLQVILGIVIYVGGALIFQFETMSYMMDIFAQKFRKNDL